MVNKKFSVLISVYYKEIDHYLNSALESVLNQTVMPNEIVLIKDGKLTEDLDKVISKFVNLYPNLFKIISLDKNGGLGNALGIGLLHCSHPLVARMDTDDICTVDRFEKQIEFFQKNPHYDIIGSNIEEFNTIPGDLKRLKFTPETHEGLIAQIKLKSPFNHPSIMFKKETVINAGNYNGSLPLFEDYALFLRLWLFGAKFYNIQEVLLNFRVGTGIETVKRRSGFHYLKKEWAFINYAKVIGAFTRFDYIKYMILKFPIRLLPPFLVLFIYNSFLRKSIK